MKAAGALCGPPRGLRDNIALIYLLATKRKRLLRDTQRQPRTEMRHQLGTGGTVPVAAEIMEELRRFPRRHRNCSAVS
jgi:hypothetical protein